jgi:hypothetical protein
MHPIACSARLPRTALGLGPASGQLGYRLPKAKAAIENDLVNMVHEVVLNLKRCTKMDAGNFLENHFHF